MTSISSQDETSTQEHTSCIHLDTCLADNCTIDVSNTTKSYRNTGDAFGKIFADSIVSDKLGCLVVGKSIHEMDTPQHDYVIAAHTTTKETIYDTLQYLPTIETKVDDKYIQILAWLTKTHIPHTTLPKMTQQNLWINIYNKIIQNKMYPSNIKVFNYESFVAVSVMYLPKSGNKMQREKLCIAPAHKHKANITVIKQFG